MPLGGLIASNRMYYYVDDQRISMPSSGLFASRNDKAIYRKIGFNALKRANCIYTGPGVETTATVVFQCPLAGYLHPETSEEPEVVSFQCPQTGYLHR